MSIDVRPLCPPDRDECILEIEQSVDMVLDIERIRGRRCTLPQFPRSNTPSNH
jgi:phosphatidylinositol glycan class T